MFDMHRLPKELEESSLRVRTDSAYSSASSASTLVFTASPGINPCISNSSEERRFLHIDGGSKSFDRTPLQQCSIPQADCDADLRLPLPARRAVHHDDLKTKFLEATPSTSTHSGRGPLHFRATSDDAPTYLSECSILTSEPEIAIHKTERDISPVATLPNLLLGGIPNRRGLEEPSPAPMQLSPLISIPSRRCEGEMSAMERRKSEGMGSLMLPGLRLPDPRSGERHGLERSEFQCMRTGEIHRPIYLERPLHDEENVPMKIGLLPRRGTSHQRTMDSTRHSKHGHTSTHGRQPNTRALAKRRCSVPAIGTQLPSNNSLRLPFFTSEFQPRPRASTKLTPRFSNSRRRDTMDMDEHYSSQRSLSPSSICLSLACSPRDTRRSSTARSSGRHKTSILKLRHLDTLSQRLAEFSPSFVPKNGFDTLDSRKEMRASGSRRSGSSQSSAFHWASKDDSFSPLECSASPIKSQTTCGFNSPLLVSPHHVTRQLFPFKEEPSSRESILENEGSPQMIPSPDNIPSSERSTAHTEGLRRRTTLGINRRRSSSVAAKPNEMETFWPYAPSCDSPENGTTTPTFTRFPYNRAWSVTSSAQQSIEKSQTSEEMSLRSCSIDSMHASIFAPQYSPRTNSLQVTCGPGSDTSTSETSPSASIPLATIPPTNSTPVTLREHYEFETTINLAMSTEDDTLISTAARIDEPKMATFQSLDIPIFGCHADSTSDETSPRRTSFSTSNRSASPITPSPLVNSMGFTPTERQRFLSLSGDCSAPVSTPLKSSLRTASPCRRSQRRVSISEQICLGVGKDNPTLHIPPPAGLTPMKTSLVLRDKEALEISSFLNEDSEEDMTDVRHLLRKKKQTFVFGYRFNRKSIGHLAASILPPSRRISIPSTKKLGVSGKSCNEASGWRHISQVFRSFFDEKPLVGFILRYLGKTNETNSEEIGEHKRWKFPAGQFPNVKKLRTNFTKIKTRLGSLNFSEFEVEDFTSIIQPVMDELQKGSHVFPSPASSSEFLRSLQIVDYLLSISWTKAELLAIYSMLASKLNKSFPICPRKFNARRSMRAMKKQRRHSFQTSSSESFSWTNEDSWSGSSESDYLTVDEFPSSPHADELAQGLNISKKAHSVLHIYEGIFVYRVDCFDDFYTMGPTLGAGGEGLVKVCLPAQVVNYFNIDPLEIDWTEARSKRGSSRLNGLMKPPHLPSDQLSELLSSMEDLNPRDFAYAVKVTPRMQWSSELDVYSMAHFLGELSHPNVLNYRAFYEDEKNYFFLMDLVDGPELLEFLTARDEVTEDQCRQIFQQILQSLEYIHQEKLIHRDIKPDNFVCADPIDQMENRNAVPQILLIDFGLACYTQDAAVICPNGTRMYMAPELFLSNCAQSPYKYDQKVDIWAAGVILCQLLTGRTPFDEDGPEPLLERVQQSDLINEAGMLQPMATKNFISVPTGIYSSCSDEFNSQLANLLSEKNDKSSDGDTSDPHSPIEASPDVSRSSNITRQPTSFFQRGCLKIDIARNDEDDDEYSNGLSRETPTSISTHSYRNGASCSSLFHPSPAVAEVDAEAKDFYYLRFDMEGEEWSHVSAKAKDLVQLLLTLDPDKRPSASEALQHEWFIQPSDIVTTSSESLENETLEERTPCSSLTKSETFLEARLGHSFSELPTHLLEEISADCSVERLFSRDLLAENIRFPLREILQDVGNKFRSESFSPIAKRRNSLDELNGITHGDFTKLGEHVIPKCVRERWKLFMKGMGAENGQNHPRHDVLRGSISPRKISRMNDCVSPSLAAVVTQHPQAMVMDLVQGAAGHEKTQVKDMKRSNSATIACMKERKY